MRDWDESWAVRPRVHNERALVRAIVMIALLILVAEVGGACGLW